MPDIYAISSAKGGVGKTTTAANLAATLAAGGHSVAAVDGDIGTPNLGPALGVDPGPEDPTIHEVLAGDAALTDAAYEGPHGLYVVPGRDELDSFRRAEPSRLGSVLSSITGLDYVIVDTSAGLTHESALPLSLADGVLLVSTPDRDAVAATRKSLQLTRELGGTVAGVTLNRAESDTPDPDGGAPVLARIPDSAALAAGNAAGKPITVTEPRSEEAVRFRRLASRLAVERVPPPPGVEDAQPREAGGGATAGADGGARRERREETSGAGETSRTSGAGETSDVPRGAPGGVRTNSGETDHDSRTGENTQPAAGSQSDQPSHGGAEARTDRSSESGDGGQQPGRQGEAGGQPPDQQRGASGGHPDQHSETADSQPNGRAGPPSERAAQSASDERTADTGQDDDLPPDERVDDDGVIIDAGDEEEDPAAAEARRTVLGEAVPESAITRHETERGDAVEYEIDPDAIPFADDDTDEKGDDEDDSGGFFGRLFRS